MPTYGYICDECGQELEAFQRMSDEPLRSCPACGKETLRRRIFATGIVFKGSGFYKTDYATKPKEPGGSNGSSEKSEPGSKGETPAKSEPKPPDKAASASD